MCHLLDLHWHPDNHIRKNISCYQVLPGATIAQLLSRLIPQYSTPYTTVAHATIILPCYSSNHSFHFLNLPLLQPLRASKSLFAPLPLSPAAQPHLPWAYFIAFSHLCQQGMTFGWLDLEIDQIANWALSIYGLVVITNISCLQTTNYGSTKDTMVAPRTPW